MQVKGTKESDSGCVWELIKMHNLEMKKVADEKKDALAAQFVAEAALRRLHTNNKEEDLLPIDSIIDPLEADIKIYKNEVLTTSRNNFSIN